MNQRTFSQILNSLHSLCTDLTVPEERIVVTHQCLSCRRTFDVRFIGLGASTLVQTKYIPCCCGSIERVVYRP